MPSPLLSYFEAAEQVRRFSRGLAEGPKSPAGVELVPLGPAAGRVLAAAVRADRDQPPFPRSTRDGFACRAVEANSHELLAVTGQIRAGETPAATLGSGEAWEIMTGAPVPDGADAVMMLEHVEHSRQGVRLAVSRALTPGENIVARAAEARRGEVVIPTGVRIGAARIALAAQCGYSELEVAGQPRVGILSTGDELVRIDATPRASQIRNSNSPMLSALAMAAGGNPIVLPTARDEKEEVDGAIRTVLDEAMEVDLLLITGGISAGRFDFVEDALNRAGAEVFFKGVAIQPGKPVAFGQLRLTAGRLVPFFALPGNPISSAVTFHLFAAPVLAALCGDSSPQPRFAMAALAGGWRGQPGLTRFLPAWCDFALADRTEVRLIPWQGSGDLAAFARANCLAVIPVDVQELGDGSIVRILLI